MWYCGLCAEGKRGWGHEFELQQIHFLQLKKKGGGFAKKFAIAPELIVAGRPGSACGRPWTSILAPRARPALGACPGDQGSSPVRDRSVRVCELTRDRFAPVVLGMYMSCLLLTIDWNTKLTSHNWVSCTMIWEIFFIFLKIRHRVWKGGLNGWAKGGIEWEIYQQF